MTVHIFRTALLQVAIRSKVWLIDVVKLGRNRHDKHLKEKWIAFFRQLFCSKATKLGYDFSNDLRVRILSVPCCFFGLLLTVTKTYLGSYGHLPLPD